MALAPNHPGPDAAGRSAGGWPAEQSARQCQTAEPRTSGPDGTAQAGLCLAAMGRYDEEARRAWKRRRVSTRTAGRARALRLLAQEAGRDEARRTGLDPHSHRFQIPLSRHDGQFVWAVLKPVSMFLVLMAVFSFVCAEPDVETGSHRRAVPVGFLCRGHEDGLTSLHARRYLLTKARAVWILVVTRSQTR